MNVLLCTDVLGTFHQVAARHLYRYVRDPPRRCPPVQLSKLIVGIGAFNTPVFLDGLDVPNIIIGITQIPFIPTLLKW